MLKKNSFLLAILISFNIFSQEKSIDSLITVLNNNVNQDTIRVNSLIKIAYYYIDRDMEKVPPYLQEALTISKAIDAKYHRVSIQNEMARYYRAKGIWDDAMKQAIIAKKDADTFGTKQQKLVANSGLQIVYANSGDDKKSVELALENLTLTEKDPPSPARARTYFDIGNLYLKLKKLDLTEQYYTKGILMCSEVGFKPGGMVMKMSLSNLYKRQKRYEKALEFINEPLAYYIKTKQTVRIGSAYMQMAQIKSLQGKHEESVPIYLKALQNYEDSGASLHFKKQIFQNLFIAYSILQDQEKATEFNRAYKKLKDSIDSNERKELTEKLKVAYETDKIAAQKDAAEAKTKLAEATSRQNENYFIGAIIIAILILMSAVFLIGRLRARKKTELITLEFQETQKRLEIEKQYKESELKALKSQMNPHFIFNSLNSIQDLILQQNTDSSYDYIVLFAQLVRNTLNYSSKNFIAIEKELEFLDVYLQLEKLRFEDDFTYTIQSINTEGLSVLSLIVQPFIENALLHGLLHKAGKKQLTIDFTFTDHLLCTIIDNGIGRKEAKKIQKRQGNHHESFALNAIEQRLEILKDQYGTDVGYQIFDLYNDQLAMGTRVEIRMPYQKEY
ncbi:histidine kinase [Aquimarina sp. AU58]|uniref:histidine kinase n=1 Tax=Aquimarina sp. AU58 TaxID=1874112 RepID=UPI00135CA2AB|nr:histidine kinase [Aquimarina sp. AU58]